MDLHKIFSIELQKISDNFKPSKSTYNRISNRLFGRFMDHIINLQGNFTEDQQRVEYKKWIDKNVQNFLDYEKLKANSNFSKQQINDRLFEIVLYKSIFTILLASLKNKPTKKISYIWLINPDKELPKLYSLMIDEYKLIAPETTLEQFIATFTGKPIDIEFKPIKWLSAKNLNAYFLDQLIAKKKISKAFNNDIWKISKLCFIDGSNFSQLIDLYTNNKTGKPKNHSLIDDLLNTL